MAAVATGAAACRTTATGTGAGRDAGTCVDIERVAHRMPFCAGQTQYRVCVPSDTTAAVFGAGANVSMEAKDGWARRTFDAFLSERLAMEGGTLRPDDPAFANFTEPGEKVAKRFTDNRDCVQAYRNYLCYLNFPRCDGKDESMLLCASVCENMMKACRVPKYLWRCGNPRYFGGTAPEGASDDQLFDNVGVPYYARAPFPGSPFASNQFELNGDPVAVCTPSLKSGSPGAVTVGWPTWAAAAATAVAAVTARAWR